MQETTPTTPPSVPRLVSVDAYRGLVMFLMLAEVLRLKTVSKMLPGNGVWAFLASQQSHVEWAGCTLHDLIQPSFSFLVGVALPLSLAARSNRGQSLFARTIHAFWRALLLVALGIFLRSLSSTQTNFTFVDTLSQIGLGYGFLYLLALRPLRDQLIAFFAILVGFWLLFALWPLPDDNYDWKTAGANPNWEHNFQGFAAHWNKNYGPTWAFDHWLLNQFPRKEAFTNDSGGYGTLSFIPTLATMILGLVAGRVLVQIREPAKQLNILLVVGLFLLGTGYLLDLSGICPIVKRIWTPSWVLFSGGICFLILSGFIATTDWPGWRRWSFPLLVIGANSIAAYCMSWLFKAFFQAALYRHLGKDLFNLAGPEYEPLLHGGAVLLIFWLILFWMHQRRIFLKL
jgi:heparan-alpha-glucosaminide N-acetyltransferase